MESLPTAFFAGIGLGIMEAVIAGTRPGSPTIQYVAFLVVILAALLLQSGQALTSPGERRLHVVGHRRPQAHARSSCATSPR